MKKTKIVCSIGPASNQYPVFKKMVEAGMNVARINFSHATVEERECVVDLVHKVNQEMNRNIAILYDTKGPDFRTGILENGEIELVDGETIRIVKDDVVGNKERITVNYKEALKDIAVGSTILLEDGLMSLKVVDKDEQGLTCTIIAGGILGDRKGVNVPGVKLNVPFISEQDREDIIYACKHDADFIALSFVDEAKDVLSVKEILKEQGREDILIISKIESETAIQNLDSILEVSDGLMVARGDLGVEVPVVNLPMYQKNMAEKCRKAGKICIVATEMLETMKKNARPTRAEVSDIANAVLDGTDAVMLSGETTAGKYPVDAVRYMANICENTEKYLDYEKTPTSIYKNDVPTTIARSIKEATNDLDIKVIVAATQSGYTARKISNLRPKTIILAACPNEKVAHSLAINFGVYPEVISLADSTDELIVRCKDKAKEKYQLQKSDYIIVSGGFPNNMTAKKTNFMKIEEI